MKKLPNKASIMAMRLKDCVWAIFGQPGVGKSTFVRDAFGANKVLFLSTDRGTRQFKAKREEVHSWDDVLDVVRMVKKRLRKDPDYIDAIAFDHIDDITDFVEGHVLEKLDVESLGDPKDRKGKAMWGKPWKENKQTLKSMIQKVLAMGLGVVFIAHEDIKTVTLGGMERDKIMPMMGKQAARILLPLTDIIGQATIMRVKEKRGGKVKRVERRVFVTEPRGDLYVKDRSVRRRTEDGIEPLNGKKFAETFGGHNG